MDRWNKKILKLFSIYKQELFIILLSFATILVFIPIFTYIYFARDLKNKDTIMNRKDTGVVLLDRNDKPFFTFYEARVKNRVTLDETPKLMQQAIIASEDKDFYTHSGFSVRGILRSVYLDVLKRDKAYGGSTITQQLVKNVLLNSNKSFLRKYQEIVLAEEIERRFSKQEILEMYLNSVYLGQGAFGVEDAALTYFGKHAKDLTLAQETILAAILPSPSALSPISGDLAQAKVRQKIVLQKMLEQGYITQEQKLVAQNTQLIFSSQKEDLSYEAPHFALMVKQALIDKYGEERISRSGFRVKTTLDLEWQQFAQKTVANQVARLTYNKVSNGAAVAMDPKTGEIRALVGSKDWNNDEYGKFNVATALRSPGSSFKPLIYAAALEDRLITPATLLPDKPITFSGNYKPLDYDKHYRGEVTVRRALVNSLNIPAVAVMQRVGIQRGLDEAKRLGITSLKDPSNYGLSLVLGTGEVQLVEMAQVYSVFANNGVKNDITLFSEIDDKNGNKIYTSEPNSENVLEPEVAFLISSILSDNATRAEVFGTALNLTRPAAAKTGTAEDYKDAWTMGYTPSLVVGVWVGNNDGSPMDQVAGSLGPAPIWRNMMEHFLAKTPIEKFMPPSGIETHAICKNKGLKLHSMVSTSSALLEFFINGTAPTKYCDSADPSPFPSTEQPTPTNGVTPTSITQDTPTPTLTPSPTAIPPESGGPFVPTATPTPGLTLPLSN